MTDAAGPNPTGICFCGCGQRTPLARNSRRDGGLVKGKPTRYCPGHKGFPTPPPVRDPASGCLHYQGLILNHGYGMESVSYGPVVYRLAHVIAYEAAHGPIPERKPGEPMLTVDHNCHNIDPSCAGGATCLHRRCIDPDHLRLITFGDNVRAGKSLWAINAAKTHCPQGHPYSEENTLRQKSGGRLCRACQREHGRKSFKRRYVPKPPAPLRSHCGMGHEYTAENTYITPKGDRNCRECRRRLDRESKQRARDRARTENATH